MVIVLVQWKIKPGLGAVFRSHWEKNLRIANRSGLVAEFLCEPGSEGYITWAMPDPDDPPCTLFVNVGIWTDADAFRDQVEPYFNDDREPEPFEAARRVRTVLHPVSRRMGCALLPKDSSARAQ